MALRLPTRIAPSILSADFACLGNDIERITPEADLLHVDVMDGHFVPNLTLGPPVVASLNRCTDLYLDCHLMMTNPGDYLGAFAEAGADSCSVHVELDGVADLITQMRDLRIHVGLAVNPETPFEEAAPFLERIDMLLIMTVHPGFGGQHFMSEVVAKVRQARQELDRRSLSVSLEVDGGIDPHTVREVARAGADTFVAGSAIFGQADPLGAARALRQAATQAVDAP
jgi:ribulose-phosphate 3-epimerase